MTASKFHPIDAIKNRASKNSSPSEHDTNTYTLTRLTSFIVEQKKTFYFCTKIMDRDSDEAYRFQIKVL